MKTLRWQQTWPDQSNDFSLVDGDLRIGRVCPAKGSVNRGTWTWSMLVLVGNRRGTARGTADSREEACKPLEERYRAFRKRAGKGP
jgi:hypothetical protein